MAHYRVMKEVKPLTSLRALAALLVFLYHYAWLFPPSARDAAAADPWVPLMDLWRQGQVGVSIFFVLSGFLIARIYFDPLAGGAVSLRMFFVKRVARIWPLFLLFALVQHATEAARGAGPDGSWWVTLSMTQGFFEELRYRGLPTAWSLTIEETFYALAPVVFWLLARGTGEAGRAGEPLTWRRMLRVAAVTATITAAFVAVGAALTRAAGPGAWQGLFGSLDHTLRATLFGRFPEFALGIMAAFVHRGVDLPRLLRGARADVLAVAAFLGIALCMAGKTWSMAVAGAAGQVLVFGLSYTLAAFAALLILALTVPGGVVHRLLSWRLLVFLGKTSYAFYLVQMTVMTEPMIAVADRAGPFFLPVMLVVANLFCAVVYHVVETPARRFIVERFG
jgi:peptidoglycan/LPS O-acetylase OafA/YrhL